VIEDAVCMIYNQSTAGAAEHMYCIGPGSAEAATLPLLLA
jgi:hypothetical protein